MSDVEKAKEAEAEIQAEVKASPRPSPTKSTGIMSLIEKYIFTLCKFKSSNRLTSEG